MRFIRKLSNSVKILFLEDTRSDDLVLPVWLSVISILTIPVWCPTGRTSSAEASDLLPSQFSDVSGTLSRGVGLSNLLNTESPYGHLDFCLLPPNLFMPRGSWEIVGSPRSNFDRLVTCSPNNIDTKGSCSRFSKDKGNLEVVEAATIFYRSGSGDWIRR